MAAVCLRSGTGDWRDHMQKALEIGKAYGLVRLFADEGVLIVDVLDKMALGDTPYEQAVLRLTRKQAGLYPNFMRSAAEKKTLLTETEEAIYRLILAGMNNEQIGTVMAVTLRTVKFHTSNIYKKLGVKNRTELILRANDRDDI